MIPIITLRRVRSLIDPQYVPAAAHALVTGAPIASVHTGYTPTSGSDMPRIWLNGHVFDDFRTRFVPRDTDTLRYCCDFVLPKFIDTDCPVEFNYTAVEYKHDLVHASATLHHVGEFDPTGSLCFVNYADKQCVSSTTRPHSTDSVHASTPDDDTALDRLVFDPESEVRYKSVDPARLLDIATVRNYWGPALNDPIWTDPIPRPGTDIAFDSEYPRGVHGEYLLLRNGSNVGLRRKRCG